MEKSKPKPTSSLLSVADVARILGIEVRRAYRWVHKYPALGMQRLGRRIYIDNPDLETFMGRHESVTAARGMESLDKTVDRVAPPSGATATAPAAASSPDVEQRPNSGSGQRDLLLPRGTSYPMVVFAGFEFVG